MAHVKGNWHRWYNVHPKMDPDHQIAFHTEGGFICVVCIGCGVYQSLAQLEAGLDVVEAIL